MTPLQSRCCRLGRALQTDTLCTLCILLITWDVMQLAPLPHVLPVSFTCYMACGVPWQGMHGLSFHFMTTSAKWRERAFNKKIWQLTEQSGVLATFGLDCTCISCLYMRLLPQRHVGILAPTCTLACSIWMLITLSPITQASQTVPLNASTSWAAITCMEAPTLLPSAFGLHPLQWTLEATGVSTTGVSPWSPSVALSPIG